MLIYEYLITFVQTRFRRFISLSHYLHLLLQVYTESYFMILFTNYFIRCVGVLRPFQTRQLFAFRLKLFTLFKIEAPFAVFNEPKWPCACSVGRYGQLIMPDWSSNCYTDCVQAEGERCLSENNVFRPYETFVNNLIDLPLISR